MLDFIVASSAQQPTGRSGADSLSLLGWGVGISYYRLAREHLFQYDIANAAAHMLHAPLQPSSVDQQLAATVVKKEIQSVFPANQLRTQCPLPPLLRQDELKMPFLLPSMPAGVCSDS